MGPGLHWRANVVSQRRGRTLVVGLSVLAVLLVAVLLTRRREQPPRDRPGEPEREEPLLDCTKIRESPVKVAKQRDPRRFAASYLCAWSRREVDGMRATTLSPEELDDVLRPPLGPEASAERRTTIRRRVLDAYLNLPEQVSAIYDDVRFWIDRVGPLPPELEPVFEERSHPRLLEFRARAPGKEEEAIRTVLAKAGDGCWRFVPGIADPKLTAVRSP